MEDAEKRLSDDEEGDVVIYSEEEIKLCHAMLDAAHEGRKEEVERLLDAGADALFQREEDLVSALMLAAGGGHKDVLQLLLDCGCPWNQQDRTGKCAGEYAWEGGDKPGCSACADLLLEWGMRCELILGSVQQGMREEEDPEGKQNEGYLHQKVEYDEGMTRLMDSEGEAVMMDWEAPLMVAHAEAIAPTEGLDVLNIGFGLGLVDEALQKRKPRTHTIIEAHPAVYDKMIQLGWDQRPGVKIVFGRWQDVLPILDQYDGIFFDTYGEHFEDMTELHEALPDLLKPGGIYSFFNGLCPRNQFFHTVYREIVKVEMESVGLTTSFTEIDIDVTAAQHWEGVRTRYYWDKKYHLPTAKKALTDDAGPAGVDTDGQQVD